jgi:hypothetical protein
VSSTSSYFYRGRSLGELSSNELKILQGQATSKIRIFVFFKSLLISSISHLTVATSMGLAFVSWLIVISVQTRSILFLLLVAVMVFWTVRWVLIILNISRRGQGENFIVVSLLFIWGWIIFLALNPNISKYHIIWVTPLLFVIGLVLNVVILKFLRRMRQR